MGDVERSVRDFYDEYGWAKKDGVSGEDVLFRTFSNAYYPYHERVNARTLALFDGREGDLLLAGGGDLPETHVQIAQKFSTTFLDISRRALDVARGKMEGAGTYVNGSLVDIPIPDDTFDAAYCAHVIYHIDKDDQATAVSEIIRVTKPGGRIVLIYRNPDAAPVKLLDAVKGVATALKLKKSDVSKAGDAPALYHHVHSLSWWRQFEDRCDLSMVPWDALGNAEDKYLLLKGALAGPAYKFFGWFEDKNPDAAVKLWSYPVVVLDKKG